MKKSSWVLTLTAGAVVCALAIGGLAYVNSERVAAQSTLLPSTMAWMPEGASVVGHLNFQALLNSPMRDKWEEEMASRDGDDKLEEFKAATGIDPFNDIERVSFALVTSTEDDGDGDAQGARGSRPPRPEHWGLAIQGSFDRGRLIAKASEEARFDIENYEGTEIYSRDASQDHDDGHDADEDHGDADHERGHADTPDAFAFVDDHTVLVGKTSYIKRMLDTAAGRTASAGPALEQRWGSGTFIDDTFWVAAAPESGFGGMIPRSGNMPPILSLALSGRLDGDIALRARGKAADNIAATQLADVVRGFVALGSLQGGQNPELGEILDSIQIDQFDNEIDVSLQVAYDTLERWAERADKSEAEKF